MTAQFVMNGQNACEDPNVTLTSEGMTVTARATLWSADYTVNRQSVTISLTCRKGTYRLPIVCSKQSPVTVSEDYRTITIANKLTVTSDTPMTVDCSKRVFNQVGGLLYLPISVEVLGNTNLSIQILP